jgi:hypothetical protein
MSFGRAFGARRVLVAALAAGLGVGAVGCQQGGRFAAGHDARNNQYGEPQKPVQDDARWTAPPIPVAPPQARATPPNFPAAWSPRGQARPWKWIVIHHSATPAGGAARFDKEHRDQGWDELGYHFVIGNGSDTPDGLIEVGNRWTRQKHGAHAKTPDNRFNDYGIGICLVGNFETGRPSRKQMQSLANVVAYLMQRYDIPANRVIGHDDTGRSTACPGHNLESQLALIRRAAADAVAKGYAAPDGQTALYATEQR